MAVDINLQSTIQTTGPQSTASAKSEGHTNPGKLNSYVYLSLGYVLLWAVAG